jgi:hypothetical protein
MSEGCARSGDGMGLAKGHCFKLRAGSSGRGWHENRVDAVAGHAALNHVDTNFGARAMVGGLRGRSPVRTGAGAVPRGSRSLSKGRAGALTEEGGGGRRDGGAKVGTSGVRVWDGDVAEVVRGRDTLDGGDWCISSIRVSNSRPDA